MCRNCNEGSINSHGFCDMCGFDEMQFINEWEEWRASMDDPQFVTEWVAWKEELSIAA